MPPSRAQHVSSRCPFGKGAITLSYAVIDILLTSNAGLISFTNFHVDLQAMVFECFVIVKIYLIFVTVLIEHAIRHNKP